LRALSRHAEKQHGLKTDIEWCQAMQLRTCKSATLPPQRAKSPLGESGRLNVNAAKKSSGKTVQTAPPGRA
jgi:hypothetical protein